MISFDSNVVLYALNEDCAENTTARSLLMELSRRDDVAVCELMLVEVYQLLRNPAVMGHALAVEEAVSVIQGFRRNPRWALLDSAPVMDRVWRFAAQPGVARRRLFDARLAYTLIHHGVTEFITRNTRDFEQFGFERVSNPF